MEGIWNQSVVVNRWEECHFFAQLQLTVGECLKFVRRLRHRRDGHVTEEGGLSVFVWLAVRQLSLRRCTLVDHHCLPSICIVWNRRELCSVIVVDNQQHLLDPIVVD